MPKSIARQINDICSTEDALIALSENKCKRIEYMSFCTNRYVFKDDSYIQISRKVHAITLG